MPTIYQSGLSRAFTLDFVDGEGAAIVPVSASYTVSDENADVIFGPLSIDVTSAPESATLVVSALINEVEEDSVRGFRSITMIFEDSFGSEYQQKISYIVESGNYLEVGVNAFARFEQLILTMQDMTNLTVIPAMSEKELRKALITAYYSIGNLHVEIPGDEFEHVKSTMDLTAADIVSIPSKLLLKLKRACLIEAESIMGGNPVEDRRRMGLMSHSAGESAHFFRPTKPLDLPVSKDTARELAPMVRYSMRVGR